MASHNIDFIAPTLSRSVTSGFFLPPLHEAGWSSVEHHSCSNRVPLQSAIGQVQAHEIQAQNPDLQGLMTPGKNGACQIIEAFSTILAP